MTPIADMVEQMLADDVPAHVIVLAIRTAETVSVTRDVTQRHAERSVTLPSSTPGALRSRRYRENLKQIQPLAKANDVAGGGVQRASRERHAERHAVTPHCSESIHSGILREDSPKEEKKKEVVTRARGTRLEKATALSEPDREFARAHGVRDPDTAWDEFRDYWVAVPGQRGVKLDWSATWRNRVRAIVGRGVGPRPPPARSRDFAALMADQTDRRHDQPARTTLFDDDRG